MLKSSKNSLKPAMQRFRATLERLRSRLNWVVIHIPFDAAGVWGLRGQIRVQGTVNKVAFRSTLFPTREKRHFLLVNRRLQAASGAREGKSADFELQPDLAPRIVSIPDELASILRQDSSLQSWYRQLNPSTRSDIAKWINAAKTADARIRRAEQIAERLLSVMEAEQDLPPIFTILFARHPQAQRGWDAMSQARRRAHLFRVFYYRTPEARTRQLQIVLEDALAIAQKRR